MAELHVFYGEFWATCECLTLHLVCHIHFQKYAFFLNVRIIPYSVLACNVWLLYVNRRGPKTEPSFTFVCYYFYYSENYIDSSLHVNRDREVDSGLELCWCCSRMKERDREKVLLLTARFYEWISMWFNFCSTTFIARLSDQLLFSAYCTTDRHMERRRTLAWTLIPNQHDTIWARSSL